MHVCMYAVWDYHVVCMATYKDKSGMCVCMYMCMYVSMHACVYVCCVGLSCCLHGQVQRYMRYVCMYVYLYVCKHACVYVSILCGIIMYVFIYVCMYVSMHACMYVSILCGIIMLSAWPRTKIHAVCMYVCICVFM